MALIKHPLQTALTALNHAIERRRHPERFIMVDQTPHENIYHDGIMSVRYYQLPGDPLWLDDEPLTVSKEKKQIPVILVPALGINSWTFDIKPDRSLVRYLMARGYQVYVIDWGRPSESERNVSLDTYVNQWFPEAVNAVIAHAGTQEASLIGYCMGGLLCLMYLGCWHEAPIRNLATIASPINFHKSGPIGSFASLIRVPALKLQQRFETRLSPLDNRAFHVPGRLLSIGFKLTNPPAVLAAYLELVRNITDREYVTDYMTMGHWFNDMVDYPGGTVRELVEKMILANHLADGSMLVGRRTANLAMARANLLALASHDDKLVSVRAAKDILRITGSRDKRFATVPGGHAGILAGSRAPANTWRMIADWLADRSGG